MKSTLLLHGKALWKRINRTKSHENLKLWRRMTTGNPILWAWFFFRKSPKSPVCRSFDLGWSGPPFGKYYTRRKNELMHILISMHIHICFKKIPNCFKEILRNRKRDTIHYPQNKTQIFGEESEILTRCERIKWSLAVKSDDKYQSIVDWGQVGT